MTANERNDRAYELYRALSDVDEKYVGEMLDEGIAEDIRAANRRKRITMRSSLTAAAAVFVLVIGIGVLPNLGGLNTDKATEKNDAAAEQQVNEDDRKIVMSEAAADNGVTEGVAEDYAAEEEPEDDIQMGFADGFTADGDAAREKSAGASEEQENDAAAMPQTSGFRVYQKLSLEDGGVITVINAELDSSAVADRIYEYKAEGVDIYEVKGVRTNTGAAVYYPDEDIYRFAFCGDFDLGYMTGEKIAEMLEGLQLSNLVKVS